MAASQVKIIFLLVDLSLMADHMAMDSFDSNFSLGDVFDPMMSVDSGIT